SSRRSRARALRGRHRRAGSGSTPHDRRSALRLATPLLLASSRAPEHDSADLTTTPVLLRPPRRHQTRASSRSTPPDLVRPTGKTTPHRPSPRQTRSVRDPQIPIGRVPHTAPFLPAVSSLGGFRTPAPSLAPPSRNGPASETLHQAPPSRNGPASETLHQSRHRKASAGNPFHNRRGSRSLCPRHGATRSIGLG